MKKTIKLNIILNTLLVLTTIVLILSTHLKFNEEPTPTKKDIITDITSLSFLIKFAILLYPLHKDTINLLVDIPIYTHH